MDEVCSPPEATRGRLTLYINTSTALNDARADGAGSSCTKRILAPQSLAVLGSRVTNRRKYGRGGEPDTTQKEEGVIHRETDLFMRPFRKERSKTQRGNAARRVGWAIVTTVKIWRSGGTNLASFNRRDLDLDLF